MPGTIEGDGRISKLQRHPSRGGCAVRFSYGARPHLRYRGLGAGAVQITLAERVTRLHKSAFPTAFFKSKIGEGNAARRSSADATAKAARACAFVRRAAPQAA